jgi:hypothetical protein
MLADHKSCGWKWRTIMKLANNIILTFVIGFIAGISPFLFMQLIPGLIDPSQDLAGCNPWCVFLTGILIGAITCIMFAKKFAEKDPSDIFFYALGIPAILIGTVTNLNTNYSKMSTQETASQLLETKPAIEEKKLSDIPPPASEEADPKKSSWLMIATAWANQEIENHPPRAETSQQYVVVIGQYPTEAEAGRMYNELSRKRLNTEKYFPKSLRIFAIAGNDKYYLSYSTHAAESEAIKVYRLLKINDPEFIPRIIKQK